MAALEALSQLGMATALLSATNHALAQHSGEDADGDVAALEALNKWASTGQLPAATEPTKRRSDA
jgi:hypothetical protein